MSIREFYHGHWPLPKPGVVNVGFLRRLVAELNSTDIPDNVELEITSVELSLRWNRGPVKVAKADE